MAASSDFADRIIELIEPTAERLDECHAEMSASLLVLEQVQQSRTNALTNAQLRDMMESVVAAATELNAKLRALPDAQKRMLFAIHRADGSKPPIFRTLENDVAHIAKAAGVFVSFLDVGPGARPLNPVKQVAALCARNLLRDFSKKPITGSSDGCYHRLASVLFEATTGIEEADLKRYCDQPDRAEPAHRLKLPRADE